MTEPSGDAAARRRGPYRNGVQTRRQIIARAVEVFGEAGYAGGSMSRIARELGLTPAAISRHFATKESLLAAVVAHWSAETAQLSVVHEPGLGFLEDLRATMRYHLTHRGLLVLFLRVTIEGATPGYPARDFIQERYRRTVQLCVDNLTAAVEAGLIGSMPPSKIESEARLLVATMDGLEMQWLLDPGLDLVGLFDDALDVAVARWGP